VGETKKAELIHGMAAALPIVIGYLPIAITFGLIAQQSGISILHAVLMSLMVYAGASQFMAVNMFVAGAGMIEITLATFILNLRHFIMGLSLMNLLKKLPSIWKILISAGLTDETFALSSLKIRENEQHRGQLYVIGIMLASYSSWALGTFMGGLLANIIPANISDSMAIALYAMFIGLLIPSVRSELRVGLIALASMLLCYIFSQYLNSGWAIVFATILGSFCGIFLMKEREE